jgi:hypothetical protein
MFYISMRVECSVYYHYRRARLVNAFSTYLDGCYIRPSFVTWKTLYFVVSHYEI